MIPFILNLLMALLWLFLSGGGSFFTFVIGYTVGFGLLALFQQVLPTSGYIRRTLALLRFLYCFGREFLVSSFSMARAVLFTRRADIYPNYMSYDVSELTKFEILILSHCVTLTPGSSTVHIADDWRTLVLHAFDARDPAQVRASIDQGLRQPLLAFTR